MHGTAGLKFDIKCLLKTSLSLRSNDFGDSWRSNGGRLFHNLGNLLKYEWWASEVRERIWHIFEWVPDRVEDEKVINFTWPYFVM